MSDALDRPQPAAGALYLRMMLVATFAVPFVLAAAWSLVMVAAAELGFIGTGMMFRWSLLLNLTLLLCVFLVPAGFLLGLVLVALRHWRGAFTRVFYVGAMTFGILVPGAAAAFVLPFGLVAPLFPAAMLAAAAIWFLRTPLGLANLFDAPARRLDARIFE